MTDKPEALRLADKLNLMLGWDTCAEAAAELRRLYAENEKFRKHIESQNKELDELIPMAERLEAQRDALLEALKSTGLFLHHCWCDVQMNDYSFERLNHQMSVVDAAIAKAEES